jgi:hypothetical protein
MRDWHRQRVRERAYAIWEEEGRRHGNDLAHWFRAEVEIPLRVTFDSNAYRQVINTGSARDAAPCELQKINRAVKGGRIRGYLSESLVTLEGIENKDRARVLGSARLESQTQATGDNTITISLSVRQDRKPLNPGFSEWIQAARKLGMRFLRGPARIGWIRVEDGDGTLFEPDESVLELAALLDKVNEAVTAIETRGLGRAIGVQLGLKFGTQSGASGWWLQGLPLANNAQVQKAISEWADADSIASHIGYKIDLFCTRDKGGSRGGAPSILDGTNQAWLTATYGVQFATLTELAAMV